MNENFLYYEISFSFNLKRTLIYLCYDKYISLKRTL